MSELMPYPPKQYEYYEFVRWSALPEQLREPKTQKEFQQRFHISHSTLARWKLDPNYDEDIRRTLKEWGKSKIPTVIGGLFKRAAFKGDPESVRLWLTLFGRELLDYAGHTLNVEITEAERVLIVNAFVNLGVSEPKSNSNEQISSLKEGNGADNK